ncbi:hypothetical protein ROZALSC1DRAFT_30727 [Rozella allomycis CSF55]|uniref:Band 7 protein domain-containing protein n=1 Tax=Rozella allomycis (strain CSF55) TaxID=988480 RepID=A0A075AX54_ROZAC|nr:Band 7 protein domain-containing protein [Rozella allomycis CSF55]RKP17467.1 hypothetical protein ROZALSC1DRAFT_30727 [Rozella allomycis CSF55]|eukprot:EPZ34842.1 Band 7 protein domain-containing protein [Rozella allomycis CSF55]
MDEKSSMDSLLAQNKVNEYINTPPVDNIPPAYSIPNSFAKTLDVQPPSHGSYEKLLNAWGNCMGFLGAYIPCCFCCPSPFKIVPQGYAGLVSRFGKVYKIVDPGLHFVNLMTENLEMMGIKVNVSGVPRQQVMTKDNVSISVDSVLYWHVIDPFAARYQVSNVEKALSERAQTTLKDVIGAHDLQTIVSNREKVAAEIRNIIDKPSRSWGVVIESVLIMDIRFSQEMLLDLSAAAKQKRLGESKVITAQAEVESAKLMREASDILASSAAMQIRYLDTLTTMAKHGDQKVIFMPTVHSTSTDNKKK